jgi:EAL domain-containing protein (putative c-di-GMP-specific phosphodiesterase class I)
MEAAAQPVVWRGKPISVGSNAGIAVYPGDGKTSDILLSRASFALVRARREAVDIAYHDIRREEAIRSKSEIALDLGQAVERGEFELYFQRQNSASTRELVGFEVLLRWNHPEKGLIPPSEFIPIAEAYGFISMIGEWVLRTACNEAARWPKPYKIAVNVAPDQLSKLDLPDIVAEALAHSGLPASRLELEMTESGIVADPDHTRRIIDRLKKMGVGLAMDDYGTGNSSLSTLQTYPFDKIKIDKSFVTSIVTNPQAIAIVRSTIILGRSLKIPILAEGVESECTMKFLRRIGCTEVQGFLFGKPMPASAIQELAP